MGGNSKYSCAIKIRLYQQQAGSFKTFFLRSKFNSKIITGVDVRNMPDFLQFFKMIFRGASNAVFAELKTFRWRGRGPNDT